MHNYYFKIEVKGRGRFPIDQLRRFEMFPIYADAASAIEACFDEPKLERTYHLGMYASSLGADGPCIARFASFGFVAKTLEVWRGGKLFYKDGEVVVHDGHCLHGSYTMKLNEMGEETPHCPACDEELEL